MSHFKSLNFHAQEPGGDTGYLWLSNNVDFIYSCILSKKRVNTKSVRKLNVFIGGREVDWNREVHQGVADIWIESNAAEHFTEPDEFQKLLSKAAVKGMLQLSLAGQLSRETVLAVESEVESTNFYYEYLLLKLVKRVVDGRRYNLVLRTSFARTYLVLIRDDGEVFHLLDFWPSPWLVLMKFEGASFMDDGCLEVTFKYSEKDDEKIRFNMTLISDTNSSFPVRRLVADASGLYAYGRVAGYVFSIPY